MLQRYGTLYEVTFSFGAGVKACALEINDCLNLWGPNSTMLFYLN